MSEVWCKNLRETAHVLGRHPGDCFHCEAFALGLAERDERVRELEAENRRLLTAFRILQSKLGADGFDPHCFIDAVCAPAVSAPAGKQKKTPEETVRLSPADASTACARCGILGTLHGATPPHTRGDTCVGFLAASAPAEEPSDCDCSEDPHDVMCPMFGKKTSEVNGTSVDSVVNAESRNAPSPPAEAPQESGVPSGKAGCRACDPLNPGDVGEPHTCRTGLSYRRAHAERATRYTGTPRGEYERMAREWWLAPNRSIENPVPSLAALLARVADERQSAIEQAVRKMVHR